MDFPAGERGRRKTGPMDPPRPLGVSVQLGRLLKKVKGMQAEVEVGAMQCQKFEPAQTGLKKEKMLVTVETGRDFWFYWKKSFRGKKKKGNKNAK